MAGGRERRGGDRRGGRSRVLLHTWAHENTLKHSDLNRLELKQVYSKVTCPIADLSLFLVVKV